MSRDGWEEQRDESWTSQIFAGLGDPPGAGASGRVRAGGGGSGGAGNHRYGRTDRGGARRGRLRLPHGPDGGHLPVYAGPGPDAGVELRPQRPGEKRHPGGVPRSARLRHGGFHQLRGGACRRTLRHLCGGRDRPGLY